VTVIILVVAFFIIMGIVIASGTSTSTHSSLPEHYQDDDGTPMHTVYKAPGESGFSAISYSGDIRYLDGVPIKTIAQFDRWRVINNHALSIRDHLKELEYQFTDKKDLQAKQHYEEWKEYYQKYRQLIVRHRLYNMVIGQHEPFTETSYQLAAEKRFLEELEKKYKAADDEREIYIDELYEKNQVEQEIIQYLQGCPRKKCLKTDMIKALAKNNSERRKALQRAYTSLLRREIIGEKKDENGRIVTRYIIRRKKPGDGDEPAFVQLPASVYRPEFYTGLWKQIVNKAELTVGPPEHLDRSKNTCTFTSLSNGSVYSTSLEKCTCPAFGGKEPCKHRVKLAMYLGYYHKGDN